ncbi:MAG: hypothetical protein NC393_07735, partial [Clostridium sp.]|nr:hypothetical protein [Clostridium sp.]
MKKFKKALAVSAIALVLVGSATACSSTEDNQQDVSLGADDVIAAETVAENETATTEDVSESENTAISTEDVSVSEKESVPIAVVGMASGKEAKTTLETTDMVALAEQKEENKT